MKLSCADGPRNRKAISRGQDELKGQGLLDSGLAAVCSGRNVLLRRLGDSVEDRDGAGLAAFQSGAVDTGSAAGDVRTLAASGGRWLFIRCSRCCWCSSFWESD